MNFNTYHVDDDEVDDFLTPISTLLSLSHAKLKLQSQSNEQFTCGWVQIHQL
jgi:hypothetical protein